MLLTSVCVGPLAGTVSASSDDGCAEEASVQDRPMAGGPPFSITGDTAFLAEVAAEGWTGNGTEADPYVIEGYDLTGTRFNIAFEISHVSYRFVIRGNRIDGNHSASSPFNMTYGVYMRNATCTIEGNWFGSQVQCGVYLKDANVTLWNNSFLSNDKGVYGTDSRSRIEGNRFSGDHRYAVEMRDGETTEIINNDITSGEGDGTGVYLYYTPACNLTGNRIEDFSYGIEHRMYGAGSTGLVIADNTFINCSAGIAINEAHGPRIVNNTIVPRGEGNGLGSGINCYMVTDLDCRGNRLTRSGIYVRMWTSGSLRSWEGHTIDSTNTVNDLPVEYIANQSNIELNGSASEYILVNCSYVKMVNRTLPSSFLGLFAYVVDNMTMTGNTIDVLALNHLVLDDVSDVEVSGNPLLNNTRVDLEYAFRSELSNNSFDNGTIECTGVRVVIAHNTLHNTTRDGAIRIVGLDRIHLLNNTVYYVEGKRYANGLFVTYPGTKYITRVTIKGNELWDGGGLVLYDCPDIDTFDIDGSNMVNGRPVAYRSGGTDIVVDGDYGQVILESCENAIVRDQSINGSSYSVQLLYCKNVTVADCTFNDTLQNSVYVHKSEEIHLVNDTFSNGGILVRWSDDIGISECAISGISQGALPRYGDLIILEWTSNVVVESSLIRDAGSDGISGVASTIFNNTFVNCTKFAIQGTGSTSLVYFNTFIDNGRRVDPTGKVTYEQCEGHPNTRWDNGTFGNYWSDYTSRYPNAGNDNVTWDTPYDPYGNRDLLDRHPLVTSPDYTRPVLQPLEDVHIGQHVRVDLVANATDDNEVANYTWRIVDDGILTVLYGNDQSYVFDVAGQASVWITVRDHWRNAASRKFTVFISDTDAPLILGVFDMVYPQGTLVEFNSSLCSDNVGIDRVTWTFTYDGEPVTLDGSIVTYLFDIPGEYSVLLNLSDPAGNWNSRTFVVEVLDIYDPVARLGTDVEIGQGTTLRLSGGNSTDNVGIVSYRWSMTSNVTNDIHQENVNFTYEFTIPGLYNITLTVYDAQGNMGRTSMNVTVLDTEPPVADPGEPIAVEPGTSVSFTSAASHDNVGIVSYRWSFLYDGDTVEFDQPYFSFTFWTEGTYVVTLTVVDGRGNEGSADRAVTVRDVTPPKADAGTDRRVDQHTSVTLDGSGSTDNVAIVAWVWTFVYGGGIVTLEGSTTEFTFHDAGVYDVDLTVTDAADNSALASVRVTVRDTTPPVADAGPDVTVDQSVTCVMGGGNSTDNVFITGFTWTFDYDGGKESLSGMTVEFTFDIPGVYTLTLMVEDGAGLSSVDTVVVTVLDAEPPVARFSMEPSGTSAFVGTTYAFDGSASTDNIAVVEWTWTVNNGTAEETYNGSTLSYNFTDAGTYTVRLEVRDGRGLAGDREVTVLVKEVVEPGTPEPEPEGPDYLPVAVIAVLVAIAVLVTLLWWRGRSRPPM